MKNKNIAKRVFAAAVLAGCAGTALAGPAGIECATERKDFVLNLARRSDGKYNLTYSASDDFHRLRNFVLDDSLTCRFGGELPVLLCEGKAKLNEYKTNADGDTAKVTVTATYEISVTHSKSVNIDAVNEYNIAFLQYREEDAKQQVHPRDITLRHNTGDLIESRLTPQLSAKVPLTSCRIAP